MGGRKELFTNAYRLTISCTRVSLSYLYMSLCRLSFSRVHIARNLQHPHALIFQENDHREIGRLRSIEIGVIFMSFDLYIPDI